MAVISSRLGQAHTALQDDCIKLHAQDFAGYRVPTFIGGGSHDDFLTPTSHLHVQTLIPDAQTYTFKDAGHSPYFETPGEFNRVADQFLGQYAR